MTDDTFTPAAVPSRAASVVTEHLIASYARDRAGDDPTPSDVESAVREAVRTYLGVRSDPPVEVQVSITDDDGMEVEQTLHLTREQATRPELLGSAVGHAVASSLAGFYIGDDGTAADDARIAAATALDSR